MKHKRIFIVGNSGAGKGVLAQALAEKLGWKFVDADFSLAPTTGRRSVEILGAQGETAFQKCLAEILAHQLQMNNIVVTTDDSIVCDEKSRALLAAEFTVYLQVSLPIQLERISHNRPLLPTADYKSFLEQLRTERNSLYEEVASYSISSDDGEIDKHVTAIINAMK